MSPARRRSSRSISLPIILASVTVALTIAMLIGWTLVILQNLSLTRQVAQNTWLLIAGIFSYAIIMSVMVMLSVFLVSAIAEVRRQNSFLDSVTHELKSPLASIKLCLETLARPELNDQQRDELHGTMRESVDRLAVFIDDILEASHLAHGRDGLPLGDIALPELVLRCVAAVASRHQIPADSIHVDMADDLRIMSDRTAVETVLKNLLDNAIKYSSRPAEIEVRACRQGHTTVVLEVEDRGIGIPKAQLKRVFERFYRVPSEQVRARHGTGLGLFVVSALVRNLGGRIEARSDGAGQGTLMRITLPVAPAESASLG